MKTSILALLAAGFAGAPQHFTVSATFLAPAKPGAAGAIAVTFVPLDPDVHVNQEPAPRLKLDPAQRALVDRQPPATSHVPTFDPDTARYLDPKLPVSFPVAWAPGAPKGAQTVKASLSYYYCSKREGWCRKGMAELEVPVTVP